MGGGAHVWYYTMEYRILVTKAILAGSELAEVASCLGNDIIIELEFDATDVLLLNSNVELG